MPAFLETLILITRRYIILSQDCKLNFSAFCARSIFQNGYPSTLIDILKHSVRLPKHCFLRPAGRKHLRWIPSAILVYLYKLTEDLWEEEVLRTNIDPQVKLTITTVNTVSITLGVDF